MKTGSEQTSERAESDKTPQKKGKFKPIMRKQRDNTYSYNIGFIDIKNPKSRLLDLIKS